MRRFWPVKVAPFLGISVKVEIGENDVLTFPNNFMNLYRLLPTFPGVVKVTKTTTFPTFPPYL
jgi:hypothetical protein